MSAEIVVPDWLVEQGAAPPHASLSDLDSSDLESHEREARRRYGRILAASTSASRAIDAAGRDIAEAGDPADVAERFAAALDGIARDHGAEFADDETSRAIFRRDFDALARHRLAEFGAEAEQRERDGIAQALADRFEGLRALAGSGDDALRGEALRQAALEAHRAQGFGLVGNAQAAFDDFLASLAPASVADQAAPADRVALAKDFARESARGAHGLLVPVAKKRLDLPGGAEAPSWEGAPAGPRGSGGSARAPKPETASPPRQEVTRRDRAVDDAASAPAFKPGHSLDAETANRRHPDYNPPPYTPGSVVRDVTLSRPSDPGEFVRVHTASNKGGHWIMRRRDIEGLSPNEIRERYALPGTPTHVSDVMLPKGTRLRIGTVNEGGGGVVQYEIQGRYQLGWFERTKELP